MKISMFLNDAGILGASKAKKGNETHETGRGQIIKTLLCYAEEFELSSKSTGEA